MVKAADPFWDTFAGEFVEILCKYETKEKMPLVIQAYLVDVDENYYFLGENAIEIDSAVRKNDLAFISIIKPPKDPGLEVLEDMGIPESEEELN